MFTRQVKIGFNLHWLNLLISLRELRGEMIFQGLYTSHIIASTYFRALSCWRGLGRGDLITGNKLKFYVNKVKI
jgi:hypothetical protein